MASKTVVVLCLCAVVLQTLSAQCLNGFTSRPNFGINGLANNGLVNNGLINSGLNNNFCNGLNNFNGLNGINSFGGIAPGLTSANTNGGSFTVTSSSPIAPSGVSVVSEYVIEGPVSVTGELPFVSAIGVDGQLPTGGQAGTTYSCGNNVGIAGESLANVGISASAYGTGISTNAGMPGARLGVGNCGF